MLLQSNKIHLDAVSTYQKNVGLNESWKSLENFSRLIGLMLFGSPFHTNWAFFPLLNQDMEILFIQSKKMLIFFFGLNQLFYSVFWAHFFENSGTAFSDYPLRWNINSHLLEWLRSEQANKRTSLNVSIPISISSISYGFIKNAMQTETNWMLSESDSTLCVISRRF